MSLAPVKTLNQYGDPRAIHAGVEEMLSKCVGSTISTFAIVYEPGQVPRMAYYGRTLTETEQRGVLATLLAEVGRG